MRRESAQAIVTAFEDLGVGVEGDMRLYENYSGRGMYGKTTTGIVYSDEGNMLAAVAYAAVTLKEHADAVSDEIVTPDPLAGVPTVEEFLDDVRKASWDSMGRDRIIY